MENTVAQQIRDSQPDSHIAHIFPRARHLLTGTIILPYCAVFPIVSSLFQDAIQNAGFGF